MGEGGGGGGGWGGKATNSEALCFYLDSYNLIEILKVNKNYYTGHNNSFFFFFFKRV